MAAKTIALKSSSEAFKKKTSYKRKTEETHKISPEVAEAWLTKNISNRRVRRGHVRRLAIAMKSGLWRETDDPIRFDWDGNMFDGQHRLLACVESGVPFTSKVIYGYPPELRHIVDGGIQRTPSDSLAMSGVKNSSHVAATLRILCYEAMGVRITNSRYAPTKDHIAAMFELHPKVTSYVFQPGVLPRGITISQVSALNYICSTLTESPKVAAEFVDVLKTGIPSGPGCPIHRYRERALVGVGFANRGEAWDALKYCYNSWIDKASIKNLRLGEHVEGTMIHGLEPKDLTKGVAIFEADDIEEEGV